MAKHTGDTLARPTVGEPIPGANARDSDNNSSPLGGNGLATRLWARGHGARQQALAVVVKHTDVQGAGRQVDATVKLVLCRVESPEVSSAGVRERLPSASIPPGYAEGGGLKKYQPADGHPEGAARQWSTSMEPENGNVKWAPGPRPRQK